MEAMSALGFSDQIKALEEEGSKLLAATQLLSHSFNHQGDTPLRRPDLRVGDRPRSAGNAQISHLTDISAEQRTIDELRKQLDNQAKQNERLETEFLRPQISVVDNTSNIYDAPSGTSSGDHDRTEYAPFPQTTSDLSMLSKPDFRFSEENTRNGVDSCTLQENSQAEIDSLRSRMKEVLHLTEQQKFQYQQTIEDLRGQLQDALNGKDSLLTRNQRELKSKDTTINRLQDTISQLERANHLQEETLVDMNERLVCMQRDQNEVDSAVAKLKSLLYNRMGQQGKSLFDRQSGCNISILTIVQNLDKCFQDYDKLLREKDERLHGYALDVENMKLSIGWKEEKHESEFRQKLKQCQQDAQVEVEGLQLQVKRANEHSKYLEKQLEDMEAHFAGLTAEKKSFDAKIAEARKETSDLQKTWEEKVKMINNMAVITVVYNKSQAQKEIDMMKSSMETLQKQYDNSQKVWQESTSKGEIAEAEVQRLTSRLCEERQSSQLLRESECKAQLEITQLQAEIDRKSYTIEDLTANLDRVKSDAEQRLARSFAVYEEESKTRFNEEVETMKTYVTEMQEKSHKLQKDLTATRTEHRNLMEKYQEALASLEKMSTDFENAHASQGSNGSSMKEKEQEVDALRSEIDFYKKEVKVKDNELKELEALFHHRQRETDQEMKRLQDYHSGNLEHKDMELKRTLMQLEEQLNLKNVEIRQSEAIRAKLHTQLQEKEMETMKAQSTTKSNAVQCEELRAKYEQVSSEVQAYVKVLTDKDEELQQKRLESSQRMMRYEEQIRHLEDKNATIAQQLTVLKYDKEKLRDEEATKDKQIQEFQESVSRLSDQNYALQQQLEKKQGVMGKEIGRLTNKLQAAEHDVALAKKMFKSKQKLECKVSEAAQDMQKELTEKRGEIDTLNSRIRWLEECLDSSVKEKSAVESEVGRHHSTVRSMRNTVEAMAQQVKAADVKNDQLKEKVATLEAALEKAAVKHNVAQTTIEQHAQELASLELRYSLRAKDPWKKDDIQRPQTSQSAGLRSFLSRPAVKRVGGTALRAATMKTAVSQPSSLPKTTKGRFDRFKDASPMKPWGKKAALGNTSTVLYNSLYKKYSTDDVPTRDPGHSMRQQEQIVAKDLKDLLDEMKNLVEIQKSLPANSKESLVKPQHTNSKQTQVTGDNPMFSAGTHQVNFVQESSQQTSTGASFGRFSGKAQQDFRNLEQDGTQSHPELPPRYMLRNNSMGTSGAHKLHIPPSSQPAMVTVESGLSSNADRRSAMLNNGGSFDVRQDLHRSFEGESVPVAKKEMSEMHQQHSDMRRLQPGKLTEESNGADRRVLDTLNISNNFSSDEETYTGYSNSASVSHRLESNERAREDPFSHERPSGIMKNPKMTFSADVKYKSSGGQTMQSLRDQSRAQKGGNSHFYDINLETERSEVETFPASPRRSMSPPTRFHNKGEHTNADENLQPRKRVSSRTKPAKTPMKDVFTGYSPFPMPKKRVSKPDGLNSKASKPAKSPATPVCTSTKGNKVSSRTSSTTLTTSTATSNLNANNRNTKRSKSVSSSTPSRRQKQQDLCRQLETKLQTLNRLSDQLQSDNEEVAHVMKEDGRKLAFIKSQLPS